MNEKVPISKRLVFINSASSLAARAINITILVWLQQYLLLRISAEEYSIYPVLMAVMVFIPLLNPILTGGLGRYVVEAYAQDDQRRVTQIVSTMVPLLLGAGLLILIGGGAFAWNVHRVLTIAPDRIWDARVMMALLVFSAAIQLPLVPFGLGLYVRQKFILLNLINLAVQLLRAAILFVLLFGVSTRVLWVVVATVLANFSGYIIKTVVSLRLVPSLQFHFGEIRWNLVRSLTSFGFWNFITGLANTIYKSASPIILNKLATPIDVTCFHLGSLVYQQINQARILVSTPLQPVMTAMHAMGSGKRLRSTYLRGGRYALWLVMLMALPLMIYRQEVMQIYLHEKFQTYADSATVMLLLLLTFPMVLGNTMLWNIGYAKAQLRPIAWRVLLIQISNLALALYLVGVRGMGAVGSAWSSFGANFVGSVLLTWPLGCRLAEVTFRKWLQEALGLGLLPSVAGILVWVGLRVLVQPADWLTLGLCTAAGCVAYGVTLLLFCLQPYERKDLRRMLEMLRSRVAFL